MLKMMKRQMVRSLAWLRMKTKKRRRTSPSSRSKRKRRNSSARRSKRNARSRRLPRPPAVPSSLRQSVSVSRLKLLRRKPADKPTLKKKMPASSKRRKSCLECANLKPPDSDLPRKNRRLRRRLRRKSWLARRNLPK